MLLGVIRSQNTFNVPIVLLKNIEQYKLVLSGHAVVLTAEKNVTVADFQTFEEVDKIGF